MAEYAVMHLDVNRKVPVGELYEPLFDLADAFSFNINDYWNDLPPILKEKPNQLRELLKPYFLKKFHTYDWYGWVNSDIDVFVYQLCDGSKEILRQYCPDLLFHLRAGKRTKTFCEFEDLCFYKNKTLILGTVSHEYMCTAYPPLTDDPHLTTIGRWYQDKAYATYTLPT